MISKDRKVKHQHENERQSKYIEREAQIIQVITANTEVMSSLKATLDANGVSTIKSLDRIHERIDSSAKSSEKLAVDMELLKVLQSKIDDNVQKILLIIDNIPNWGNFSTSAKNMSKKSMSE